MSKIRYLVVVEFFKILNVVVNISAYIGHKIAKNFINIHKTYVYMFNMNKISKLYHCQYLAILDNF
jgi:hypothetical protein